MAKQSTGYTVLQLSLHWLIVLLVLFQLIFGEDMGRYNYFLRSGQDVTLAPDRLLSACRRRYRRPGSDAVPSRPASGGRRAAIGARVQSCK